MQQTVEHLIWLFLKFVTSQDAQEMMLVSEWVSQSALADFTVMTLVSEDAAHNCLQMSSSRDLTDMRTKVPSSKNWKESPQKGLKKGPWKKELKKVLKKG